MAGQPGETTRRTIRDLARERHERVVHLLDATAIRRALLGDPVTLTELERGAIVVLADEYGLDHQIVAEGLGRSKSAVDTAIIRRRERLPGLAADLLALTMTGPAEDLIAAVAVRDPDGVRDVLAGWDRQHLAALCVVLADMATDALPPADPLATPVDQPPHT